jgi:hypothetical protein
VSLLAVDSTRSVPPSAPRAWCRPNNLGNLGSGLPSGRASSEDPPPMSRQPDSLPGAGGISFRRAPGRLSERARGRDSRRVDDFSRRGRRFRSVQSRRAAAEVAGVSS